SEMDTRLRLRTGAGPDTAGHGCPRLHRRAPGRADCRHGGLYLVRGRIYTQDGPDPGAAHQPGVRDADQSRGPRRRAAARATRHCASHCRRDAMKADATVVAEGLRKAFVAPGGGPLHAVRDISMTMRAGELTALVGPDGAGKTTLLRMMAG